MRVGTSRYCLTPNEEFYLIGYFSENRKYPATGIHDDIYCNSMIIETKGKKLFIFSADFIEFEEEMVDDVKSMLFDKYGIERDMILMCATHNHSSVMSYHKHWHSGKFSPKYYTFLMETICKSYETCIKKLTEATAKYGKKVIIGYYGNRNHPGELADNEVIVINFFDQQNQLIGEIINWAVHSTVIGPQNTKLTGDLAGQVCHKIGNQTGCFPLFIVGAAGDCSNRNQRQGQDFDELERISNGLTHEILHIEMDRNLSIDDIHYQSLFHTIHHNMAFVHKSLGKHLENLKNKMAISKDENEKKTLQNFINKYEGQMKLNKFHLDIKVCVYDLGGFQIITFPGELGSKLGISLKEDHSKLKIIAGYTNGFHHYFMSKEDYEGEYHETIGRPIPKGESEKIINKIKQASYYMSNIKIESNYKK